MQSKKFTNPEDELPKVFSDILNEEEMKACIESRKNLEQETAQLMNILQKNPKDYGAIQQQISSENSARIEHNVTLQRIQDRYNAKNAEIRHLQQKEIELNNQNADLEIDNAALKKWNESPEKRNVKNRAITVAKNKVQLEEEHEILQEELDAERETQKQERKNKALKATKTAFENLANDPEIQQQMEDLAQKEAALKMKQEIGNELDLTIKKTKQNQQAAFANDTKANVAAAIYNGDDSSGLGTDFATVQQVNAGLDARIENEHELSEHIDNVQECDRLRRQIYDYKYNRDVNGDKWLALYKQTFPILQDGTNLDSIDDPRIIAQIADQYAEKNNTGIKYNYNNNNNSSAGDSGNFNSGTFGDSSFAGGNLFVEEEEE